MGHNLREAVLDYPFQGSYMFDFTPPLKEKINPAPLLACVCAFISQEEV